MVFKTSTLALAVCLCLAWSEAAPRTKRQARNPQFQPPDQYQQRYDPYRQPQARQDPYQQDPYRRPQPYQPSSQDRQFQDQYRPPQSSFQCPPGATGQYPYPEDCSRYYRCDNGYQSVMDCPHQLIFNPFPGNRRQDGDGYCDFPARARNLTCRRSNRQLFKADFQNLCENPPTERFDAPFHVRHPLYCNAFFTCEYQYLYDKCMFCGEGAYFDAAASECRSLGVAGGDTRQLCGNSPFVDHGDKAVTTLGDDCWVYATMENPHRPRTPYYPRDSQQPSYGGQRQDSSYGGQTYGQDSQYGGQYYDSRQDSIYRGQDYGGRQF